MSDKKLLVTGSSGLIGSEVVRYFDKLGWKIYGVDNNMRSDFFGERGDTRWVQEQLIKECNQFEHVELDIRDRKGILELFEHIRPDYICHTAAQPSHDLAASRPFDDFDVNAVGTLNLLEGTRRFAAESPFAHLSTNKVYGDGPNFLNLTESDTRYDFADATYKEGIKESFSIDQCKHSLFGASKVAGDIMVQEYGKYFDMPTCALRGGCLTGPNHAGVELHGFLSYLIKVNLEERKYTVFGYKGKQVRDNIHSYDVARFIHAFFMNPRSGEVYNIGGGRDNSTSILEAFTRIENISGKKMKYDYSEQNRIGDHICYISDLSKMKSHYPEWNITKDLQTVFEEIASSWEKRLVQ